MSAEPPQPSALVTRLRRTITQEIYLAAGLARQRWARLALAPLFFLPAQRFARRAARFDADLVRTGFSTAARTLLGGLVERVGIYGAAHIPENGPVLLACNHPGAYDGIAVFTGLQRNDLALVASGVDFTRSLPNTSPHLIYVTKDTHVRMTAVRQSLRHLQAGGALMIFASGLVDPDPALWPQQARLALRNWYGSVALFLRHVPQTRLVTTITSHVLAESVTHSPLLKLVRQDWEKRRLAEYLQLIQQLAFGRRFGLSPRVSFAPAVTLPELGGKDAEADILAQAEQRLEEHVDRPVTEFQFLGLS